MGAYQLEIMNAVPILLIDKCLHGDGLVAMQDQLINALNLTLNKRWPFKTTNQIIQFDLVIHMT